jgi:hypothetical protein
MQRWIAVVGLGLLLSATVASAQHSPGRGPWGAGPEPRFEARSGDGQVRGFCYSRRTQECSSIFKRDTEQQVSAECSASGWRRYHAFRSGREAMEAHRQWCSGR